MIDLVGYNFLGDGNALDPALTDVNKIQNARLTNGIIDHFNISGLVDDDSDEPHDRFSVGDVINAAFNGNISTGSLEDVYGHITGYKIKKRKMGDFEWITLYYRNISTPEELTFTVKDTLNASNVEYEYAFVPIIDGKEGNYVVQTVFSKFNGVFFTDLYESHKMEANVEYGDMNSNQKIGIYEPFGKQYPVVVSNGVTSYKSGSVSGMVLPENYDPSTPIDRQAVIKQRELLLKFLNNRKPKILKDWNGNIWLCMVTSNPTVTFVKNNALGINEISVGWTEVGDANSNQDLYETGLSSYIN